MQAENFNFENYCKRIGFTGNAGANVQTLIALMRCQLFSVPFENLDVQAGKIVSLVPEDIVAKIIDNNRGGYCYEVNSLFAMALHALGIEYYFVGARPMFYPTKRPKTHMVVIAHVDGEDYLCDLGFGSFGIRSPIALSDINKVIQQDDDFFKLVNTDGKNFLLQALVDGEWANQYGFDLYPQELIDFMPANYLNSTHPDTIFVQKLLIVMHSPRGRKILVDQRLKTVEKGVSGVEDLNADAVTALLKNEFGLVR
jgi:N-hydroxyarylamine O-acetyltransferase